MSGIWIPVVGTIALSICLIAYFFFASQTKKELIKTIQAAIEKGSEISPELIEKLQTPVKVKVSDLRKGIMIGAFAVAFAIFGSYMDGGDEEIIVIAIFPAMLSLGYLIMWKFTHNED